jgi:MFS family permease
MPEHIAGEGRNRASGLKVAFDVGGAFVAFVLLGVLLAGGDILPAIGVTALILVVGTVVMLAFVPPVRSTGAPARGFQVPSGFTRLIVARFLFLLATYAVGRFLVLLVADRLGIGAERAADEAGGLLALFTLATAAVAVGLGALADRIASRDLMVIGALAAAVGIGVLVPAAGIAGVLAGGLLMSIGTGAFMTANWSASVALVPPGEAGRLLSIANLGTAVAAAVAGLVGPVIDVAGFAPALLAAALISAAAIVPLMAASPHMTRTAEGST